MIRRPPRSTQSRSSAASDVYKRQGVARRQLTFLLLRQKKSKQKKRRPWCLRPSASLRATCGARFRRGLAKLAPFHSAQTTPALIRLSLRSSAQPGRGNRDREPNTKDKEDKSKQGHATACPCFFWYSVLVFFSPPLVYAPRSGGPDGSGLALSERSAAQRV